jgi:hypothetical protein
MQAIRGQHAKLFGIKPQSVRTKFTVYSFAIYGNDLVRDRLMEIQKPKRHGEWSNEELYKDTSRYNLIIQPIAVPTFQLKATSYNRERCYEVIDEVRAKLTEDNGLDLVQFKEPESVND